MVNYGKCFKSTQTVRVLDIYVLSLAGYRKVMLQKEKRELCGHKPKCSFVFSSGKLCHQKLIALCLGP